jgi:hypothetical protein
MLLNGMWIEDIELKTYLMAEPGTEDKGAGDKGDDDKSGEKEDAGDKPDITKLFQEFSTKHERTLTGLRREIIDLKKSGESVKALEAKLAEIESRSTEKQDDSKTVDKTDDKQSEKTVTVDAETQKLIKDLQKKIADQEKSIGEERKARVDAEQKRSVSERDRELIAALTEIKALHLEHSRRMHLVDIIQDEDGTWMYQDGEELISIAAGVEKYQPKEMREARTRRSGSGGETPEKQDTSTVKQLSDRAIVLGVAAMKAGGSGQKADSLVMDYQRARRLAVQAGADDQTIVKAVTSGQVA